MRLLTYPVIFCAVLAIFFAATPAGAREVREIVHNGIVRTYLIQKPTPNKRQAFPLVILLHGGTQSAKKVWRQTSLPEKALAEKFILVAPDAIDGTWNDGREALYGGTGIRNDIDDVGFISKLIDEIAAKDGADLRRVYVTGASNGGMMSFRLACELAGKLAGVAPFIATMRPDARTSCKPRRTIPMMITISTSDPFVSWDGAPIVKNGETKAEKRLSAPDTVSFWTENNRCREAPKVSILPDINNEDGTRVRVHHYTNCAADVLFYTVVGGGHTWPGSKDSRLINAVFGNTTFDLDAGTAIWSFFRDKKLP